VPVAQEWDSWASVAVVSVVCSALWAPRSFRLKHRKTVEWVMRGGKAFKVFVAPLPCLSLVWYPLYFVLLFFVSWRSETVAEHQVWNVLLLFKVFAVIAHSLLQEARQTCLVGPHASCSDAFSMLSAVPARSLDRATSTSIVVLFCAALSAYAAHYVRVERRHRFRMLTKLRAVNDDGTLRRSDEKESGCSQASAWNAGHDGMAASRPGSPKRQREKTKTAANAQALTLHSRGGRSVVKHEMALTDAPEVVQSSRQ